LHGVEEAAHFLRRQHRRQPSGPPGAQGVQPRQVDAEHLQIEEQQGVESLVLGAGGDVAVGRQVGEEQLDLGRPHGVGVALMPRAA
jgi:hypothetical protein